MEDPPPQQSNKNFSFLLGLPDKLDGFVSRLEARLGLYPVAMVISILLIMTASLYFPFSFKTKYLGTLYKELSLSPLGFEKSHEIQYRILTPFLANTVGLKGDLYIWFPLLMGGFFLAAIYIHFRKNHYTSLESAGMSALMAFSIPILFGLYFQGYTDTTSYLVPDRKPYISRARIIRSAQQILIFRQFSLKKRFFQRDNLWLR